MRRGSTYDVTIKVDQDVTSADVLHVAFRNTKRTILVKEHPGDVTMELGADGTTIAATLRQADTLQFKAGQKVEGQVRCRIGEVTYATPIFTVAETVDDVIEDGVI